MILRKLFGRGCGEGHCVRRRSACRGVGFEPGELCAQQLNELGLPVHPLFEFLVFLVQAQALAAQGRREAKPERDKVRLSLRCMTARFAGWQRGWWLRTAPIPCWRRKQLQR